MLFAIFWMGTLAVFDRDVDRWMMPMTRVAQTRAVSLDALKPIAENLGRDAGQWWFDLPTDRVPTMQVSVYDEKRGTDERRDVDPSTGLLLEDPGTLGGTGFSSHSISA